MCVPNVSSPSYCNQREFFDPIALREGSRQNLPVVLMTVTYEGSISPVVWGDRRPRDLTSCCEKNDDSVKRDNPEWCNRGLTIGVMVHDRANENQGGSSV